GRADPAAPARLGGGAAEVRGARAPRGRDAQAADVAARARRRRPHLRSCRPRRPATRRRDPRGRAPAGERRPNIESGAGRRPGRRGRAALRPPPRRRRQPVCRAREGCGAVSADLLGAPPLTTRRRGTVLVVDDEEGVRASIRAILEETCEVLEAEHGAAALEILAQREVDLVMLDQRMPGEAGVDILPRVKALDPSVVVVIATAVRDVHTAVEAL